MAAEPAWLELRGLTKRYAGVLALDDASFGLERGRIHGLVGANGAGKSTLVKCLTGMVRPTSGSILVDGRPLHPGRPSESLRAGITSVPQELTVAPTLSVADNVMLGHEPHLPAGVVRRRELRRRAAQALAAVSLDVALETPAGRLPLIERRLLMVARALARDARLVVFDEPTATLAPHEAELLLDLVRSLAERGVSVLYVSHHLREIEELCDRVTVLRDGRVVADLERATHAALVELLAPEAGGHERRKGAGETGREPVLEVRGVTGLRLRDVTLTVSAGEIVGLAGLAGSGARELLLTACGAAPYDSGEIVLAGRRLRSGDPRRAVAAGVGFLPGDRALGTLPSHAVRPNVSLPVLGRLGRLSRVGLLDPPRERSAVAELLDRVALRTSTETPIASLSGGNQQKALVARWIGSDARLLLLDDPTAGVDVATRPEIHAQIRSLTDAGLAVLLVSTDAEELAELSDRVVVFEHGTVAGELARDALTPTRVLTAMTGGGAGAAPSGSSPTDPTDMSGSAP